MARRAAQGGVSPEPESRHTPPESFPAERTKETDRYGLVLVLTLLALLTSAITSLGTWSQLLALVPQAAALLLALYTSGTSRRLLRLTVFAFLGLTALLSIAIAVTASAQVIRTGYAAIMGGLVFTALLAIGRRLARQQRVTMQTVFGALYVIGYTRAILWDNYARRVGYFELSRDIGALRELDRYIARVGLYYDIAAFHDDDADVAQAVHDG